MVFTFLCLAASEGILLSSLPDGTINITTKSKSQGSNVVAGPQQKVLKKIMHIDNGVHIFMFGRFRRYPPLIAFRRHHQYHRCIDQTQTLAASRKRALALFPRRYPPFSHVHQITNAAAARRKTIVREFMIWPLRHWCQYKTHGFLTSPSVLGNNAGAPIYLSRYIKTLVVENGRHVPIAVGNYYPKRFLKHMFGLPATPAQWKCSSEAVVATPMGCDVQSPWCYQTEDGQRWYLRGCPPSGDC